MSLQDILGQDRAIRLLQRSKESPAHAYLFHGPDGVGKRSTATHFAKTMFCKGSGTDCCDQCNPCQKVDRGTHPDFIVVEPENNKIRIETIRGIVQEVGKKPFEADQKIILFDEAHRMTNSAANALLKQLEEPPGSAIFFLITSNLGAILPTIRSRCRSVPFVRLDSRLMKRVLEKNYSDRLDREELWIALARGRPGRLVEFDLEKEQQVRVEVIRLLEEVPGFTPPQLLERSKSLGAKKEELESLVGYFQEVVRDLILLKLGGDPNELLNIDIVERLQFLADQFPENILFEFFEVLRSIERVKDLNPNPQLLWDSTLIKITQAVRPL